MSHRKAYSQGNIPFSWEQKPGVSKFSLQDCPTNKDVCALNVVPPSSCDIGSHDRKKIPLPPSPYFTQHQLKSRSKNGHWQVEDPFLVAYKNCTTRVEKESKLVAGEKKKGGNVVVSVRKSKLNLSCKYSCDVRDGDVIRLGTRLPNLPRERIWPVKHGQEPLKSSKADQV